MSTHTIKLEAAIAGHEAARELVFREPKWSEFMRLGPCYRWVPRGDGNMIAVPDNDVIERYAEACLVKPNDPLMLSQLGLADAHKVVDLFVGFGLAAEGVAAASRTSSSTSSKSSSGDPQTSAS
ncbi:hypothetical protein MKK68_19950 [Methylobacterium sp. E-016]|uniref:hypothetical protein n=1 Tax=Methylobacterium sp. E-016 TaxID=2836556 RepID=UPI001FBB2FE7|nr:hypothetical protein [Methylobacterium sp. E-016]MCJ2077888.1 hypothetical protein [Methylobacterium sp. E-016]